MNSEEKSSLTLAHQRVLEAVWKEHPYLLVRKIMGADEIALANDLVRWGYLCKGHTDDKQHSVGYGVGMREIFGE